MPSIVYSPADIPSCAVISLLESAAIGTRTHALLQRSRPDLVFVSNGARTGDSYVLLTAPNWRHTAAYCRSIGMRDDHILVMPELTLNWPLAEWSYSYWAVPLDFIEPSNDGSLEFSFCKFRNTLAETGLLEGEFLGQHVCDGYKAGHPSHAAAYAKVLDMLDDEASQVDYLTILFGEPNQVWESWCRNVYNQLEYMDYITISPGDVIINCGIMGGSELPLFIAALDGRGTIVNIDPLGYDNTLTCVREVLEHNPSLHIEIRAAAHNAEGTLRLPIWHGMPMGGRAGMGMPGFPEQDFPARSIDSIVHECRIESVDYIKMDIEGAEIAALEGATHTISRFRPQLAISIYHARSHYWKIPLMLRDMCHDYRFFIKHYHYTCAETLIYAIPQERPVRDRQHRVLCNFG